MLGSSGFASVVRVLRRNVLPKIREVALAPVHRADARDYLLQLLPLARQVSTRGGMTALLLKQKIAGGCNPAAFLCETLFSLRELFFHGIAVDELVSKWAEDVLASPVRNVVEIAGYGQFDAAPAASDPELSGVGERAHASSSRSYN
jgi:hypothetical protein